MPDQKSPQELLESLRRLSDDELLVRVKSLAARKRRATVLLVAHLAELDTRDVHLRAGYSSLFVYCRDVLALSDHEAYNRMEVARTARRFPLVLDLLASGAVSLTTVRLLGPHLTADNNARVLESARGKKKAEVEEIVARLAPRPDVPASVRKLPARVVAGATTGATAAAVGSCSSGADSCPSGVGSAAAPDHAWPVRAESSPLPTGCPRGVAPPPTGCPRGLAEESPAAVPTQQAPHQAPAEHLLVATPTRPQADPSAELTPLSPDRYRYQLTIGRATLEKLRLAKDMLRHALSSSDDEALLDRALTLLLGDLARIRLGSEKSARAFRKAESFSSEEEARPSRGAAKDSRDVPVAVKRAVLGARPRALRVRCAGRPPLRRARLRGVPPPAPLRRGRGGDRREHRAPV